MGPKYFTNFNASAKNFLKKYTIIMLTLENMFILILVRYSIIKSCLFNKASVSTRRDEIYILYTK